MTQLLLETIKIHNGQPQFLAYHQQRFDHTRRNLWQCHDRIDLADLLQDIPSDGIYRCRILYHQQIERVEYIPYISRNFRNFKLITDDQISYEYKFLQRDQLQQHFECRAEADDILIVKQGRITDTSIANVAFFDKNQWITPEFPLLHGTTRQRLLQEGRIKARDIRVAEVAKFSQMALLNAMLEFYVIDQFVIYPS
jgi:4-amino-4-deoxychorismate lyase